VVEEPAPRKKRAIVDEEDESPRSKKRRRDDDDDDRPRRNKKARRYDDDDDWQAPSPAGKKGHASGRIGLLLVTIGSWLYFSLYVLFTAGLFLLLVGALSMDSNPRVGVNASSKSFLDGDTAASLAEITVVAIGLLGLGNWIVSLVGFSFCIGGPQNGRAPAILSTSASGVHLFLVMLCFLIAARELRGYGALVSGVNPNWILFSSLMWVVNTFIPALIYGSRMIGGEYIIVVVTGAVEIARLFFVLITIRTLANVGKNYQAAERAQIGIVATAIVVGGGAIISLFVLVLLREARFSSLQTITTLGLGWAFILSLAYTIMLIFPALTAGSAYQSLGRRSR
jgi:hypothetical protein